MSDGPLLFICQGDPITFAKVGGPPAFWYEVEVVDLASLTFLEEVSEVDTLAGYVMVPDRLPDGRVRAPFGVVAHRRIEGRFAIVRPPEKWS